MFIVVEPITKDQPPFVKMSAFFAAITIEINESLTKDRLHLKRFYEIYSTMM